MRKPKNKKEILGLAGVFSALVLCVTFLVQAIRRKSVWEALLAVLAAEGAVVGAVALTKTCAVNSDVAEEKTFTDELFEGEERREAELHLHIPFAG